MKTPVWLWEEKREKKLKPGVEKEKRRELKENMCVTDEADSVVTGSVYALIMV